MSTPESTTSNGWHGGFMKFAKMKLLVIDDEPVNVALLEDMLAEAGFAHVKGITDSRAAIDTSAEFAPDLILLDLTMPHVDGYTILETLRSQTMQVFLPIIVLTADASEQAKWRALKAGATDFLLKRFDHLEVLLRIANLLEMRRLHVELDMQRAAFEDAVRARSLELRELQAMHALA